MSGKAALSPQSSFLVLKTAIINQGINSCERSKLSNLDFVDDITVLLDSTQGLQGLVSAIGKIVGGMGLSTSDKKTKMMLSGNHQPPNDAFISKNKVEVMKDFTYLGSSINNQCAMDHEIMCRIGYVCAAFNQLNKIWTNKKFTLKTKFHFYNSNDLSTLLYGCETWDLKTSQEKKLDAFYTRCIRKSVNIRWNDFITNEEVQEWSKQPPCVQSDMQMADELVGPHCMASSLKVCQPSL